MRTKAGSEFQKNSGCCFRLFCIRMVKGDVWRRLSRFWNVGYFKINLAHAPIEGGGPVHNTSLNQFEILDKNYKNVSTHFQKYVNDEVTFNFQLSTFFAIISPHHYSTYPIASPSSFYSIFYNLFLSALTYFWHCLYLPNFNRPCLPNNDWM